MPQVRQSLFILPSRVSRLGGFLLCVALICLTRGPDAFAAGSWGEVYVTVNASPDPLPSGWKWQLSYQDINGSWYSSAQGDGSSTTFKQDPTWINKSIRWRCQLLYNYSAYGSPQEKINPSGSDAVSFFVSVAQAASPPSGVSATDGQYANMVVVSWNSVSGASSYQIWRATSSSSGSATQIGTSSGASYNDTGAASGTTYYYWVKAVSSGGSSGFSSSDTGYLAVNPPAAPTGVSASDGSSPSSVSVSWNAVSGASSYEVWRNVVDAVGSAQKVGDAALTSFTDASAAVSTVYYYWVRARNAGGAGVFSSRDTGYLQVVPPSAPTGVSASDGVWSNNVRVTWNGAAGAFGYEVWRSASSDSNTAAVLGSTLSLSYDDAVSPGVTNYYWIRATNSAGVSALSAPDGGYASASALGWMPAPTTVSASDGLYSNRIAISWGLVSGASGYEVWRGSANSIASAAKLAESASATYDDYAVSAGSAYYYWIKATNASASSALSESDSGYMARTYSMPGSIAAGEYFVDGDPGAGNGVPLAASDFFYGSDVESVAQGIVNDLSLSLGYHRIGLRFRKNGVWGNAVFTDVYLYGDLEPQSPSLTRLTDAEYFVDNDYGYGQMFRLAGGDGSLDSAVESVAPPAIRTSDLEPGTHQIGSRFQKNDGTWSEIAYSTFYVFQDLPPNPAPTSTIVDAEYFWDEPPVGDAGFPLPWGIVPPLQGIATSYSATISSAPMQPGWHKFGSRFKDSEGGWGTPLWHLVQVVQEDTPFSNAILHVESNIGVPSFNLDSVQRKGDAVNLRVPSTIQFENKTYYNMGWIGTGDAPANGDSNQVSFLINRDSTVTWIWSDRRTVAVTITNDFGLSSGAGTYLRYSAVTANVPAFVYAGTNVRWRLTNFVSTGSAPAPGISLTQVVFSASVDSSITYQWVKQYRVQTFSVNGRIYNNWKWYDEGTSTELYPEPDRNYVFGGWGMDGSGTNVPGTFVMNAPRTIEGVFVPSSVPGTVALTTYEINGSFTTTTYTLNSKVTVSPRVDLVTQGTSRDVVDGWSAEGAVEASGDGTNVTLMLTGDISLHWRSLRQYYLVPRCIPAAAGAIRLAANQSRPDTNWYDTGVFRAVATPAQGYRFAGWYMKNWKEPKVEAALDERMALVALFRREQPLTGFVDVRGGTLTSPNTTAYAFTNFLGAFRLQQKETTTEQYARFLNESLQNNTITYPNRISVRGQNPLADLVQGVRVEYFAGDNFEAEPLFRNYTTSLYLELTNGSPASANYGSPPSTVSLTDAFAMKFMGEIYMPITGTAKFRETSDDAAAVYVDGIQVLSDSNSAFSAVGSIALTQGWHAIEVQFIDYTGIAYMQIQWDPTGGSNFADVPAASLRCRAIASDSTNIVAASGVFTYYPDQELFDLNAPNANIEFVNGQFRPIAGAESHPVVEVTWYGADAYCRWLSECSGEQIELPTEWMWEFAASGGNSTIGGNYYPWGPKFAGANHNQANYIGQGGLDVYDKTAPVATFPFYSGLYDMAGNVWEWTSSKQSSATEWRVIRGGSFNQTYDPYLATSYRLAYKSQDYGDESTGFRPAVVYTNYDFRQAGYVAVSKLPALSSPSSSLGGFEDPQAPFQLKAWEVGNRDFAQFLNAASSNGWSTLGGSVVMGAVTGWYGGSLWVDLGSDSGLAYSNGIFAAKAGLENQPVSQVSWYGAAAYVQWLGVKSQDLKLDLPSEWQWEKAATRSSASATRGEKRLLPSARSGLEVPYSYDMWPGFFDASGNLQEWTRSFPDSSLTSYAVLRGGAWNLSPRSFTYRDDYASKSEAKFHFGLRPAVISVRPQFGWRQDSLVLAPSAATYTQILNAITFNPDTGLAWSLVQAPGWVSLTDIGGGYSRLAITAPSTDAVTDVGVQIYDGVMSNRMNFTVVISTNALVMAGLPAVAEYEQDGRTRDIYVQAIGAGTNGAYTWTVQGAPAWASIQSVTGPFARLSIQTTNALDQLLNVEVAANGVSVTGSMRVVVGNVAPVILTGPSYVEFEQIDQSKEITFTGYDPNTRQALRWSLAGNPAWAAIVWSNQSQARIRITRPSAAFGTNLTVRLSDGLATGIWQVALADINHAPVITEGRTNISVVIAAPRVRYAYHAVDQDLSDTLSWSLSAAPAWMTLYSFSNRDAVVAITPQAMATNASGLLRVTDGYATNSITISVAVGTNTPPVISGDTSSQSYDLLSGVHPLYFTGTDADQYQQVDLGVAGPASSWFTWYRLAPNIVCALVDTSASLSNQIVLVASDGFVAVTTRVAVVIAPAASNTVPQIVGMPPDLTLTKLGTVQQYPLSVLDPDASDWISWRLVSTHPDVQLVSTGPRSGTLIITPLHETPATSIVLRVSDGKASADASFTLTVGPASLNRYSIMGGEYFFDVAPTNGGGIPLTALEANAYQDTMGFLVPIRITSALTQGYHRVGIRLQRKDGGWGTNAWTDFYVYGDTNPVVPPLSPILAGSRYAVTTNFDVGAQRKLYPSDAFDSQIESISPELFDSSPFPTGTYRTLTSFQASPGGWNTNGFSTFYVYDDAPVDSPPSKKIIGAEYFWDSPPSPGFAYPLDLVPDGTDHGYVAKINTAGLPTGQIIPGYHLVGIRFQDETKRWGNPIYYTIQVDVETQALNLVNLHVESNIGAPELAFDSQHPSNSYLRLSVPETYQYSNVWWAISGWIGVGDVPGYGDSNKVAFTLTKASDLTWIWVQDVDVYSYSDYGSISGNGGWTWYPDYKTGYGTYKVTGLVTLSVTDVVSVATGERMVCAGYTGTGSAPTNGYLNSVTFTALTYRTDLTWNWQRQYALTTNVQGSGRIFGNKGWINTGTVMQLTAVPEVGSRFVSWQGDASGTNPSVTVTMTAPKAVTAIFTDLSKIYRYEIVDPISGQTNLVGLFEEGTTITSTYPRLTHLDVGSRYVVTGWTGVGSVPASGLGTELSFAIYSNSQCRWVGTRQYCVSVEAIPSNLGAVTVSGAVAHPGTGWFDEGIISISNAAVAGAHFWAFERDLKGAGQSVAWQLQAPLDVASLFRRDRSVTDMVAIAGGTLSSTNANASGFDGYVEDFAMKSAEVSCSEFVQYLNESTPYKSVEVDDARKALGRSPARPFVRGLKARLFESSSTNGVPVLSRCLDSVFSAGNFSSYNYFSPAVALVTTGGVSAVLDGQLFVPTDSNIQIRVSGSAALSLTLKGAILFTNVMGSVTSSVSPGYGWMDIRAVALNAGTNPAVAIEWKWGTNTQFSSMNGRYLRHESQTANSLVKITATTIGTDGVIVPTNISADLITLTPANGANFAFGSLDDYFVVQSSVSRPASGLAGLMVRVSNRSDSPYLFLGIDSAGGVLCRYRSAVGSGEAQYTVSTYRAPDLQQLRLTRVGNRLRAEFLSGGVWMDVCSQSIEERWLTVGVIDQRTLMAGFYSDSSTAQFSGYRYGVPNAENNYDGLELLDLSAEVCPVTYLGSNFVVSAGFSNLPMVEVSWFGAKNYALWLRSVSQDNGYDLPTEWQFEYAGSAGDSTSTNRIYPWPSGSLAGEYANIQGVSGADSFTALSPCRSLAAYRGLYDLGGNAWEWTDSLQWINGIWRTIRGGSWAQPASYAANSYRGYYGLPYYSNRELGFRVVRNAVVAHDFVRIPGGSWQSANSSVYGFTPTIGDFYIKATEVTVGEYADFLNWANSGGHVLSQSGGVYGIDWFPGQLIATLTNHPFLAYDNEFSRYIAKSNSTQRPMTLVSWHGAQAYSRYLGTLDNAYTYDLPTEWEWEKASRGGIDWSFVWQNPMLLGALQQYSLDRLIDVASKGPETVFNASAIPGLYDISGNAAEWTLSGTYQQSGEFIIRGLAVGFPSDAQGISYRGFYRPPGFTDEFVGFRPVARPSNLSISMVATNFGFARNSGTFRLPVVCNNPRSVSPLNWFVENSPAGVGIQSSGDQLAYITVNTYGVYTGTTIRVLVNDGLSSASLTLLIGELVPAGMLRVDIGPSEVIGRGAGWRVVLGASTNWSISGGVVSNLSAPSQQTVEFKPVMYWISPANQQADISQDQVTVVVANYTPELTTNGTPKHWLADAGLPPTDQGSTVDSDGDGQPNWAEYLSGTIPTDPESLFWIPDAKILPSGSLILSWSSSSNIVYLLQSASDISAGFTNTSIEIPAVPPLNTYTTSVGQGSANYYRIKLKQ